MSKTCSYSHSIGFVCGLPATREWELTSNEWKPICDGHMALVLMAGFRHREITDQALREQT